MASTLPRHGARIRPHRVRHAVALTMTGVLTFAGATATAAYLDLRSQQDVSDVNALLAGRTDRPTLAPPDPDDPNAGRAMNILVMGTDYRGEGNDELAGAGDEFHSDSTLVVHVSADRRWIEVVSIPRDSLVDIPACTLTDGSQSRPRRDTMFNAAFTIGGGPTQDVTGAAACTILTVEKLTGVRITDHVVVKMNGVVGVVDAIGGVRMCFPEPVIGEQVDLSLPEGPHTLTGYEAINFLRARKGEGMGLELRSDLERIKRQQAFVSSMMRDLLAQNVITDAPRLFQVVSAVLGSISTNPELGSPQALAGVAWSLRGIDTANIVFTPLPVTTAPTDKDRVVWVTSQTDELWARIAAGGPPPSVAAAAPDDAATGDQSAGADGDAAPDGGTPDDGTPDDGTPDDAGTGTGTDDDDGDAGTGTGGGEAAPTTPTPTPTPSLLPGVCP